LGKGIAESWADRHGTTHSGEMLTAQAQAMAGQPALALDHARRAVAAAPDSLEPRLLLGRLYQGNKRYAEAESTWQDALRRFPGHVGIGLDLALSREQQGDVTGAVQAVRDVLKQHPENPRALNFLGYLLADHNQNLEEALALIQRALERDPDNGAYVDSLGWVFYRLGRLSDARAKLERAVYLTGGDPVVHEHLGDVYKDLRLLHLARDQYRLSVAGDQTNSRVKAKLSQIP
jgi:Flp pilus assembly protein TadD